MKIVRWEGQDYPLVEVPTFGEAEYAEKKFGTPMEEWTQARQGRAAVFWSIRRVSPNLLPWEVMDDMQMDAFEGIDTEPEAEPGPTVPAPTPEPSLFQPSALDEQPRHALPVS